MTCTKYQTYILEDFIRVASTATSWMRRQGEEDTARNEGTCSFGLASGGKNRAWKGSVNWIPLDLGLIVVIWAANFLTIRPAKAKRLGMERLSFARRYREESLIDSLAYPAKGQTVDSQVDDQTWHDLALDAVFDQLNYAQSSLGAEALYQKNAPAGIPSSGPAS